MLTAFDGTWCYRSMLNDPDPKTPFEKLRFAIAIFHLEVSQDSVLHGRLEFGDDFMLLQGECSLGDPHGFLLRGVGASTNTQGWIYDYRGFLVPKWLSGVGQVQTVVGSVTRVVAHGPDKPAGVVASFYAVRQA